MKNIRNILIILVVVAVAGIGVNAFAHGQRGYGHHGWGDKGPGWHHRGWGGPGYGHMMGDLSENEIKKMDELRSAFFNETEELRQDIYAKELELRSELAKENPDAKKAANLQKEISELESKLDQKRVDHMVQMRKIYPEAGRGFMGRGPMGYGYGGSCWR